MHVPINSDHQSSVIHRVDRLIISCDCTCKSFIWGNKVKPLGFSVCIYKLYFMTELITDCSLLYSCKVG